jgi:hypothetical protein
VQSVSAGPRHSLQDSWQSKHLTPEAYVPVPHAARQVVPYSIHWTSEITAQLRHARADVQRLHGD